MKLNIAPLIRLYLFPIIGLSIFCGCHENNQPDLDCEHHCMYDTIFNNDITYLPDIYIGDKDIYLLSVELLKVDELIDMKSYVTWYNKVNTIIKSNHRLNGLSYSQISDLIDKMVESIRKYGQGCNASISERSWLKYGWNLYSSLAIVSKPFFTVKDMNLQELFTQENNAWLELWAFLSKVIEYEIEDTTGSSAAYDTPITYSKIIESRKNIVMKDLGILLNFPFQNEDAQDLNEILNYLMEKINSLNIVRYNDISQNYQVNEDIVESKAFTINYINQWIEARNKIASYVKNKKEYDNNTSSLLRYIHITLHNIRYREPL
ncbi:MAG: hypothetical protein J1F07_06060 [Muribaculaceae bacterium]|nr:hypothetical protein [Muribaculaceae bacterium]